MKDSQLQILLDKYNRDDYSDNEFQELQRLLELTKLDSQEALEKMKKHGRLVNRDTVAIKREAKLRERIMDLKNESIASGERQKLIEQQQQKLKERRKMTTLRNLAIAFFVVLGITALYLLLK